MSIVIQYQMDEVSESADTSYLYGELAIIVFLAAIVTYYVMRTRKSLRKKPASEPAYEVKKPSLVLPPNYSKYEGVLTDRQKDILAILQEQGKPVNQTLICERLGLPKSSVSRNIASLADLGLVEKKRVGMSTFISLPE